LKYEEKNWKFSNFFNLKKEFSEYLNFFFFNYARHVAKVTHSATFLELILEYLSLLTAVELKRSVSTTANKYI